MMLADMGKYDSATIVVGSNAAYMNFIRSVSAHYQES